MSAPAQRSDRRADLVAAARALLSEGAAISITAAARRAGMSRATAYRVCADPRELAAEAGLALPATPFARIVAGAETPRARARAVGLHLIDLALANERAFRRQIADVQGVAAGRPGAPRFRRSARRVPMFAAALADLRPALPPADFAALLRALCAVTGPEAMVSLIDVAGATPAETRATVLILTDCVLDRFLTPIGH